MHDSRRACSGFLAIGVGIWLVASGSAAGAAVSELEPNGSLAGAQRLEAASTLLSAAFPPAGGGALVTGTLATGDVDYYAFDLAVGELVTAAVVTDDEGALADPTLALFDPTGALVASDDDSGPGFLPALRLRAQSGGTWKVAVSGFGDVGFNGSGHSESFAYRLVVSVTTAPPSFLEAASDTNGSFGNADPVPPGGGTFDVSAPGGVSVVTASISPGDVDYWRVPLAPGRKLSVALYDEGGGALADPVLRILSDATTPLRYDDDAGPGFLPALASTTAPASSSSLTLAVSGFPDANFDGVSHAETFTYQLVVALGPAAGLVCDVNGDRFVDRSDVDLIFAARGQPASGSGDPRDVDGDGQITVLDGRTCTLQCGNAGCAPAVHHAACGLMGPEALAPLIWFALRRRRRAAAAGSPRGEEITR